MERVFNISKDNPLAGSNYIKLPKALDHLRQGQINIQNLNDNECLKQFIRRIVYQSHQYPASSRKIDEILADELDFEDIKLQFKIKDTHNLSIGISVFDYENMKNSCSLHIKKTNMSLYY